MNAPLWSQIVILYSCFVHTRHMRADVYETIEGKPIKGIEEKKFDEETEAWQVTGGTSKNFASIVGTDFRIINGGSNAEGLRERQVENIVGYLPSF